MQTTKFRRHAAALVSCGLLTVCLPMSADEGMWTFDNPPVKQLAEKYNFTPTQQWLDHLRLASVRLNDGGSGSFVSPHGLLLTNHHVARGQLQKNSTAEHDYVRDGFYAETPEAEMKSPDLEVNVLVSMEDVTARVNEALKGAKSTEEEFTKRKAVITQIESESTQKTGLRSDVVTLYQGGEYWLYRYKKYTDLRIVFAPEQQIAFFGGDPDNFTYPRYDLDMAFFRVYEDGKPIHTPNYLKWNPTGAGDQDLVFVPGHPGSTKRLDTVAQVKYWRDEALPNLQTYLDHRRDALKAYSERGAEQARQAGSQIFFLENSIKAYKGEFQALHQESILGKKDAEEADFRKLVAANPEWQKEYGSAWGEIAAAEQAAAARKNYIFHRLDSSLMQLATSIVQYVAEIKKPDGERLPGYHDSQLESLRLRLFSPAPVYPEMEEAQLEGSLNLGIEKLGRGDEIIKTALAGLSPHEAATQLIGGTKLADPAVRKQLVEGGESAVAQSTDSLISLARKLDPMVRANQKWNEDHVESVIARAGEALGKARFLAYGKSSYPDATFTLRLSYGKVDGYPMNGTIAPPKTTMFGLYDRAASFDYKGPFVLPARYADGRANLDLSTPLDFVTTNDIIGGNSGSPVIDRAANLVGLIFDGNIESLAGDYVYDGSTNRAVAVHSAGMTEALRKLYHTDALLKELLGE